jgi:hypothetical protein
MRARHIVTHNEWREIVEILFANWNPFPSQAYCERMGWEVHPDGTVDTPGGRFPTSDLIEIQKLEALYRK